MELFNFVNISVKNGVIATARKCCKDEHLQARKSVVPASNTPRLSFYCCSAAWYFPRTFCQNWWTKLKNIILNRDELITRSALSNLKLESKISRQLKKITYTLKSSWLSTPRACRKNCFPSTAMPPAPKLSSAPTPPYADDPPPELWFAGIVVRGRDPVLLFWLSCRWLVATIIILQNHYVRLSILDENTLRS